MSSRRKFIRAVGFMGIGMHLNVNLTQKLSEFNAWESKGDVNWKKIRKAFLASDHKLINFNNGSAGIMPQPVLNKYFELTKEINSFAPYEVLLNWENQCQENLLRLADLIKIESGQLTIVRNTTEAINIVLWGIDLQKNDEIICASWDYPFVHNTLERIKKEKSINISKINEALFDLNDEEIVEAFRKKISANTRLMVITWITHREGHILPVKEICKMAKAHDIDVLIDGAHVVGQLDIDLNEMGCDYFASSLHKWLNAAHGTGLLFVKKEKIKDHYPLLSYSSDVQNSRTKYEHLGTRAFQNLVCVGSALDFLQTTGIQKKQSRLQELKLYWMNRLKDVPGIQLRTNPEKSCAVASFSIKGMSSTKIKKELELTFGIHVKSSGYPGDSMVRISPNIYNNHQELDKFVEAMKIIVHQSKK